MSIKSCRLLKKGYVDLLRMNQLEIIEINNRLFEIIDKLPTNHRYCKHCGLYKFRICDKVITKNSESEAFLTCTALRYNVYKEITDKREELIKRLEKGYILSVNFYYKNVDISDYVIKQMRTV